MFEKNIWQVLSSFRKRALHPFCFLSCLCRHCSYGLASSGQVCEWTQVLFQWYLYSSRYVWYGRVCCVNTKMGRTPTDSGGLRLVIMHNHQNEEERKIWKRKLEVKYPNTRKSTTFNIRIWWLVKLTMSIRCSVFRWPLSMFSTFRMSDDENSKTQPLARWNKKLLEGEHIGRCLTGRLAQSRVVSAMYHQRYLYTPL